MKSSLLLAASLPLIFSQQSHAVSIQVDYTYDTLSFFDTAAKKAGIEAAASRWSDILADGNLGAVSLTDNSRDDRIGFTHPGTGANYQVSPAVSSTSDAVIGAGGGTANEYRGAWSISSDIWVLYVGGRSLSSAGVGGGGSTTNISEVYTDPNSVLNRGFNTGLGSLATWGGSLSFDNDGDVTWHFDPTTESGTGETDLYSIALHEIGHTLGLSVNVSDWENNVSGGSFIGSNALAAYNADNGTSLTSLNQVSATNRHWEDGAYDSKIFAEGNPNYVGTVGEGNPQDLLMEPTANFISPGLTRFEVTNTDVGALQDVGWKVIPEPGTLSIMLLSTLLVAVRRR